MPEAAVTTESTITCPVCGIAKVETMPTDACQYFYECTGCHTLLRPKLGDCCVFCSYGSVPCPPIQAPENSPLCCQSEESRVTAEIRPGVQRPDWSVITMPAARDALLARGHARGGLRAQWHRVLSAQHDLLWRSVLGSFAAHGRPPTVIEAANQTGLLMEQAKALLLELQAFDLLGLSQSTDTIIYAYPFTTRPTEHRVTINGHTLRALCAIDALGIGDMCQTDATVVSSCRQCRKTIEIGTVQRGTALSYARPRNVVVWYDLVYHQAAATSCCPSIAFFCCNEHLQQWIAPQATAYAGHKLALDEALEVGRAIFGPVLAPPPTMHLRP